MTSALQELAHPDNLDFQLKQFYRETKAAKRHVSGVDRVSLDQLGSSNPGFTAALSAELLSKPDANGTIISYKHQPLKIFPIEKGNGEYRIICIPTVKDRLVQKSILRLFETKKIQIGSPISFGDRPGRGVHKAIRYALSSREKNPWVYKTDITKFFCRFWTRLASNPE